MANTINATQTGNGGLVSTGDDSGVLNIQTNETTAVSIDASQNVTFTNPANLPNTFGFKNRIINGAMGIWQRGTSGSVVSGGLGYTADRTYLYTLGSSISWSQQTALTVGTTQGQSALLISGAAGNTALNVGQRIESVNIKDCAGSAVTFSCWLYSSAIFTPTLYAATANATDNFSGGVTQIGSLPALPTIQANTWTYVTATFTLPSSAVNGLDVAILFGATTSGSRYITGVQLEKGTQATSFDFRSIGTELALCQRYCFASGGSIANRVGSVNQNTTQSAFNYSFPVTMRSAPSITYTSLSNFSTYTFYNATGHTATALALNGVTTNSAWLGTTFSVAATAGSTCALDISNSDQIIFTAEL